MMLETCHQMFQASVANCLLIFLNSPVFVRLLAFKMKIIFFFQYSSSLYLIQMDATLNGENKFTFLVKLEHYTKIIFVILKETHIHPKGYSRTDQPRIHCSLFLIFLLEVDEYDGW